MTILWQFFLVLCSYETALRLYRYFLKAKDLAFVPAVLVGNKKVREDANAGQSQASDTATVATDCDKV